MLRIPKAIVCHFDILGFRSLVRSKNNIKQLSEKLNIAIKRALEAFGVTNNIKNSIDSEWRIRIFSDCICFAKPLTDIGIGICFNAVCEFIQKIMFNGFLIRGGIAIGDYLESDFFIFSEAQIKAYDLESKEAIFPRVVLANELISYIEDIDDDSLRLNIKEYIISDNNSKIFFINFMLFDEEDGWISGYKFYLSQKEKLEKIIKNDEVEDIIKNKYKWLAILHNWTIKKTAKILKISGILNEDNVWSFSSLIIKNIDDEIDFFCLAEKDGIFDKVNELKKKEYYSLMGIKRRVDWIKEWPHASTEDDEDGNDAEDEGLLY